MRKPDLNSDYQLLRKDAVLSTPDFSTILRTHQTHLTPYCQSVTLTIELEETTNTLFHNSELKDSKTLLFHSVYLTYRRTKNKLKVFNYLCAY